MKRTLLFAILALTAMMGLRAQTQGDEYKAPYTFVTVQDGAQNTYHTSYSFGRTWMPTASLSIGHMVSRDFGLRLNVNGAWAKSNAPFASQPTRQFNYNYITTNADLLVNMMTIAGSRYNGPLGLYLVGGMGVHCAWNNTEAVQLYNEGAQLLYVENDRRHAYNLRMGALLEYSICKTLSVNLEADYNYRGQTKKVNFVTDRSQLELLAGLTFKFGYRQPKSRHTAAVPDAAVVGAPVVLTVANPETSIAPKKGHIDECVQTGCPMAGCGNCDAFRKVSVFFDLRGSEMNAEELQKVTALAEWMKQHPAATVLVQGYADKGTGNSELNMDYSQKRANAVADKLKELGVDASRITIDAKGDTIQPYGENDKNRVVIMIAG